MTLYGDAYISGALSGMTSVAGKYSGNHYIAKGATVTSTDVADGVYLLIAAFDGDLNWRWIGWVQVRYGTGSVLVTTNSSLLEVSWSGNDLMIKNTSTGWNVYVSWSLLHLYP
jgi:hypothetical protein